MHRRLERRDPAEAGADEHAVALRIGGRRGVQPGVLDGHGGRGDGVLDEQVHLPLLFFGDPRVGSKSRTSPAMRVGYAEASNRVIGPMPDSPAHTRRQLSCDADAQGAQHPHSSDDDPAGGHRAPRGSVLLRLGFLM
jgi:hypothetical protein